MTKIDRKQVDREHGPNGVHFGLFFCMDRADRKRKLSGCSNGLRDIKMDRGHGPGPHFGPHAFPKRGPMDHAARPRAVDLGAGVATVRLAISTSTIERKE